VNLMPPRTSMTYRVRLSAASTSTLSSEHPCKAGVTSKKKRVNSPHLCWCEVFDPASLHRGVERMCCKRSMHQPDSNDQLTDKHRVAEKQVIIGFNNEPLTPSRTVCSERRDDLVRNVIS